MGGRRKYHGAEFKAQVSLAVLKGDRTVEGASKHGVRPTLIHNSK